MSLQDPEQRYELLVEQAILNEEVWALESSSGLVHLRLQDGKLALPLWPSQETAALESPGTSEQPLRIGLETLFESVLPQAEAEGALVAVFPLKGAARVLEAPELLSRLRQEWEQDD
jgi:hypothetical protein